MTAAFRPHVLVTGAASGIGRSIALSFAGQGSAVTLVDFDETRLTETVEHLRKTGSTINSVIADLRDPEQAEAVIGFAFAASSVHVLVNAAGVYPAVPILDVDSHVWDSVQAVNVRAPMLLTIAFARQLIESDVSMPLGYPNVVNISSGAALRARPGAAPYTTSKAALEMVTKACALELGPFGIRVNAVAPGFVEVDSTINPLTEEYISKVAENPLGRRGRPSDIASAVQWVTSPSAEWVTGEVVRVDGGASAGAHNLPVHWTEVRTEAESDRANGMKS